MSLTFWIPFAAWLSKKRAIWIFTSVFILFMGFTRLYLGVHFPTDLFMGWLLGGIILVLWFRFRPFFEKTLDRGGTRIQNISAAFLSLFMVGIYQRETSLPALFLGFCLGYVIMKKRFPFSARAEINGKKPGVKIMIFRCLSGFLGMAIIYLGLKLLLPGEGSLFADVPVYGKASPYYGLGRFIRYGLMGLWASAGAPKMFQRMGLAAVNTNENDLR